jgi:hypothetical protein
VRRRSILIGILALAVVLTTALLLLKTPDRTERKVRLRQGTGIDSIVLAGPYDTVSLARDAGEWRINGEEVNQVTVENLLYAAENLQVVSVYDDLPASAAKGSVRVSFFREGRRRLSYRVSGEGGRFFLVPEGDGRTFRVELPGYADTDLSEVFSVRPNHYTRHMLIDLLPSEIREVEVNREGEEAFRIAMDDSGHFSCNFPGSGKVADPEQLDELSLRLLFSYFTNIRFERKLEVPAPPDPSRFMATLRVESRDGEKHRLDIYSMPADEGTGNHIYKAVVIHNDDPFPLIIKYIYLDVLMRPVSAYYVDNR